MFPAQPGRLADRQSGVGQELEEEAMLLGERRQQPAEFLPRHSLGPLLDLFVLVRLTRRRDTHAQEGVGAHDAVVFGRGPVIADGDAPVLVAGRLAEALRGPATVGLDPPCVVRAVPDPRRRCVIARVATTLDRRRVATWLGLSRQLRMSAW